ncbi:hypothetical protein BAC2_02721 [uncultured bacterium]|nr:hypothetical protein BAC2_02721 [uncultured bacterium]
MSIKSQVSINEVAAPIAPTADLATDACEAEMRRGQILVIQGMVITVASILVDCGVCFQSGTDTELAAIMFDGASPMLLATLVGMGLGTVLWLFGCVFYLRAAMDADPSKVPE